MVLVQRCRSASAVCLKSAWWPLEAFPLATLTLIYLGGAVAEDK